MVYLLFKHNILKERNIRTVSDKLPIKLIHIGREFVDQELLPCRKFLAVTIPGQVFHGIFETISGYEVEKLSKDATV